MKQKQHKKLWVSALCLGLAITLILQATLLAQDCYEIRQNLLRLHLLANSDSPQDQALKLKVRDALLAYGNTLFPPTATKEEAIALTQNNLQEIERIAEKTLQKEGCSYPVTCCLDTAYFTTRVYDSVTLPAGTYTALRVVIGQGKGQNWWCVMFPPLCIPSAADLTTTPKTLENSLSQNQQTLVENGVKYQAKFKVVEWFQNLKNKWFS